MKEHDMEKAGNFQWELMVAQLRGTKFNNFGLHLVAQLSCGDVIAVDQHLKLTERLYTPTVMERFAAM
jgi:hypothetical protein